MTLLFLTGGALLEGFSFTLLLGCFSAIGGSASSQLFSFFPKTSDPFFYFLFEAIGLQVLRSLCIYLGQKRSGALTYSLQSETQLQIMEKIFRMPYSEVSRYKSGDLIDYATAPPHFFPVVLEEGTYALASLFMIVTYLTLMSLISLPLTLLIMMLLVLVAFAQKTLLGKISSASKVQTKHMVELTAKTTQNLEGIQTLHLHQKQEETLYKTNKILQSIAFAAYQVKKWHTLVPSLTETLGILIVGASLLLGVFFLQDETGFSMAYLLTFLTLTHRLGNALRRVMEARGRIASQRGSLKRMVEILDLDNSYEMQGEKESLTFTSSIDWKNVSFSYPHHENFVLQNISLTLTKGSFCALVGASGAGKSTLLHLLMQLYDPTEGEILMDGKPIHAFSKESWRSLFGIVPQHPFLFHESICDNIRFGKPKATHEEIVKAAQMAGAASFIQKLPKNYDTIVGERGYRLSGGEKQRIALARALIRDPDILVLDEATSHLDSQSEWEIQEALLHLKGKKTLLLVAHRLSTIQLADKIYVLDQGQISQQGTHQDLMQTSGPYQNFWRFHKREANPLSSEGFLGENSLFQ
ncbi:MAG: Heterocyst differentiation ATP-binding protein HepA [Chlamydiae bacterium]|nr:Heterocyst differentiation ATP-binding protein HepA [Chlamydiota bacterium]